MTRFRRVNPSTLRIVVGVATLAAWCIATPATNSAQARPHDSRWTTPSSSATRMNPLSNRPDTVAGGAKLFRRRCAACHGADARGGSRAPDLTRPDVQLQSDGELFWRISSGNTRKGMPTFSFLPELQRWQLVQHLRGVSTP
jgi:mono/diheme cytochrome c family protein